MRSQPRQSLIPPPQISKTNRQPQRDHNQNDFSHAAFGLLIVFQQVVEVARTRSRIRINAKRILTSGGRSRLVQPEDRWAADQRSGFGRNRRGPRRSARLHPVERSRCRGGCRRRFRGRTCLCRRRRRQQRRAAHAAVTVGDRILIAAASAAHGPSFPLIDYAILKVSCTTNRRRDAVFSCGSHYLRAVDAPFPGC